MVQEVVRSFLPGVLIGLLCGAGGAYFALERPWATAADAAGAADAGPTKVSSRKKKHRKRRKRRRSRRNGGSGDSERDSYDDVPVPTLTSADRKLAWKGPKISLPARSMDMSSSGESRPLNSAEINRVVSSRSKGVLRCIAEATGNAPLKSEIRLVMLVDGSGRVTKSRVRAPAYLLAHGFYPCARDAAGRLSFPSTGAHTIVTAPYDIY